MINFPKLEEEILEFWKREKIFQKTLDKPASKGDFVFYEGPPTANGRPGIHHVLTRSFKDLILRYKTMRGYHVPRKAGWDTHGLPVELEVEKKLGISGKKQIENIVPGDARASIVKFNKLCKESVWTYKKDWEEMTDRVAFWIDLEHPYVTYENQYIETLWQIIKQTYDKGLLYEDYKIVPYCPRCGTSLSSHEVAQGYKDDTEDPSVYIKFEIRNSKFETKSNVNGQMSNVYFLVWTTTPWTLPGNVALAVGEKVTYVRIKISPEQAQRVESPSTGSGNTQEEHWILAKDRLSVITEPYEIVAELTGKDLAGTSYEPLYLIEAKLHSKNKADFMVYSADFVSTTDGTGIVHIAPAFGEDDNALGKEKGLSTLLTVDPEGKINVEVPGQGKFVKTADKDVIEDLRARNLLYRADIIKHTYPFCWRCSTPLLYYAKISWWIRMSKLRDKLITNNKKVNWVPEHIKDGRFGEWLRGIKDWAFSRERYWGTPLPIWRCEKCKNTKAVGSIADFSLSKNKYFLLRHGEANSNTLKFVTSNPEAPVHLTDHGKTQIAEAAKELKKKKIDVIISSDFVRTSETAEIVGKELGIPVVYDKRLHELKFGEYEGLAIPEYLAKFAGGEVERFETASPNGENLRDVLRREINLIRELENKYEDKNILLVGHGDPFWVLEGAYRGRDPKAIVAAGAGGDYIKRGEIRELPVRNIPQDDDGFLDLHRPYVDQIAFTCEKCDGTMHRVTDVIDVWFDSGAMPFAQATSLGNSKFESRNPKQIINPKAFPADYICEAIDQTRGWFYTLLAVSTLLGYKIPPYKNVICLGHILDAKGQKMSKSKGNVIVPSEVINKFGVDAIRMYLYTAGQPGDPKRFDLKGVDEVLKKTLLILWNIFEFWRLYAPKIATSYKLQATSSNVLDSWILAKLNLLTKEVTEHLEKYKITEAGRELASFINDLSTWYVRRSRDRFKNAGGDKESALTTLTHVLTTTVQLFAPFTPFVAEAIYRDLDRHRESRSRSGRGDLPFAANSIHLTSWPESNKKLIDKKLLEDMEKARRVVSLALEERAKAGIAIRQPLSKLTIKNSTLGMDILEIIKDEINVKNVEQVAEAGELAVELYAAITPELKLEGLKRELVRAINSLRKEAGLTIHDRVDLYYETSDTEIKTVFEKFSTDLLTNTLLRKISSDRSSCDFEKEVEIAGEKIWIGLAK